MKSRFVSRPHYDEDVIEEWTEIRHQESGPVTLQRMASTSLLLTTNVYLTHFFGDWAKEMLTPITEQITPGTKVLDSKLGVRADQFQNPSFILSLNGKATETNGEVLAGSLAWSGSFQCEFDDNGQGIRALCGINPFASAYHLKPERNLCHAEDDLGLERSGPGRHEPETARLGARFRHARRPPDARRCC